MTPKARQHGAALILMAAVLVLGVGWYTVRTLNTVAPAASDREAKTGLALQAAKQALLAYVAQYAARSTTSDPGQLPCPESVTLANPGQSSASCSASAIVVGRLPWKTLGVDQLYDGYGEPLWYVMRGFRDPPINFGSTGQLTQNGAAVVAMIIAPGPALNTAATAGTPPAGCTKQDQMVATRNFGTLIAANFLECGVTSGSIAAPGDSTWTNDRVITITQGEWADAIAGSIADRLQRQVAPAMYDFYDIASLASWGQRFFPNASAFNAPATNDLCGDLNVFAGMPPTATVASAACGTAWDSVSVSGLGLLLTFGGCSPLATEIQCDFTVILGGVATPRINVSAPNVGYAFRRVDTSQITIQVTSSLLPPSPASTSNYSGSVSAANGRGTFSFDVSFPALSIAETVRIRIPYPTDFLASDVRSAWYITNGWDRFTYYGASRAASHSPLGTCNPGGIVTGCLTVNNMATPSNDKRLVLVLMGRQLPGTTVPSGNLADYMEGQNAIADVTYETASVSAAFNDRVAACPFTHTAASGSVTICN